MSTPEQIRDARERWENCGRGDGSHIEEVEETLITLADAYCDGPDWHDRPTGPGRWLLGDSNGGRFKIWDDYTQEDIDRGAPFACKRVFGPIPPDPKGT